MNKFIIIGHLAKHHGISKQTLIHYDRIGLLKPSLIQENKYRYYTFEDANKLDLILNLKAAGLSLKEIMNYMTETNLENSIQTLKDHSQVLEKKISKLQRTHATIQHKIKEMEQVSSLDLTPVVKIKSLTARPILKVPIDLTIDEDYAFASAMSFLNTYIDDHQQYYQYSHTVEGVILPKDAIDTGHYEGFDALFIFIDTYTGRKYEEVLPQGLYACYYHHGYYAETASAYAVLLDFIKENNYEIIGDSIEIPTITSWAVQGEKDYVTEIQIPIKKG